MLVVCLDRLSVSAFGLAGYVILIYDLIDAIPDEVCYSLQHRNASQIVSVQRSSTYGRRAGRSSKSSTSATATETWCPWRSPICSFSGYGGVIALRYVCCLSFLTTNPLMEACGRVVLLPGHPRALTPPVRLLRVYT